MSFVKIGQNLIMHVGGYQESATIYDKIIRCWWTFQYFLQDSGNCLQCLGNPFSMKFRNSWYWSSSCSACLRSSCRCKLSLCWSLIVHISAMDMSGWLCMSSSANASVAKGSCTGWRDDASGAPFFDPLTYVVVTLYLINRAFSLWSRGFSNSSRRWLLRIGIRGLWSVTMVRFCSPIKNNLHLETAQHTASISSSMTAYLDSMSLRNHDPAWMRFHVPAVFCCKVKPRPWWLYSICRQAGRLTGIKVQ